MKVSSCPCYYIERTRWFLLILHGPLLITVTFWSFEVDSVDISLCIFKSVLLKVILLLIIFFHVYQQDNLKNPNVFTVNVGVSSLGKVELIGEDEPLGKAGRELGECCRSGLPGQSCREVSWRRSGAGILAGGFTPGPDENQPCYETLCAGCGVGVGVGLLPVPKWSQTLGSPPLYWRQDTEHT